MRITDKIHGVGVVATSLAEATTRRLGPPGGLSTADTAWVTSINVLKAFSELLNVLADKGVITEENVRRILSVPPSDAVIFRSED